MGVGQKAPETYKIDDRSVDRYYDYMRHVPGFQEQYDRAIYEVQKRRAQEAIERKRRLEELSAQADPVWGPNCGELDHVYGLIITDPTDDVMLLELVVEQAGRGSNCEIVYRHCGTRDVFFAGHDHRLARKAMLGMAAPFVQMGWKVNRMMRETCRTAVRSTAGLSADARVAKTEENPLFRGALPRSWSDIDPGRLSRMSSSTS